MVNFVLNAHIKINGICVFCDEPDADATVIVSDDNGSFLTRRPYLFGVHLVCWYCKSEGRTVVDDPRTLLQLNEQYCGGSA